MLSVTRMHFKFKNRMQVIGNCKTGESIAVITGDFIHGADKWDFYDCSLSQAPARTHIICSFQFSVH